MIEAAFTILILACLIVGLFLILTSWDNYEP
mgnify:CR=1 FL=1